jgi:hypothetical protein
MADNLGVGSSLQALRMRGDARHEAEWQDGDPDYVELYSLTAADIPALIALATQWVDEPPEDDAVYGPVHAWRALGQMRALEAVQPLLDVQDRLDDLDDDWYLDEFQHVFGLIGPPAIEALATFLGDDSRGEFPRASAGNGLREIAVRFPETRQHVISILTAELARHEREFGGLNGFLLSSLLDLKAVESAEAIERAFAADVIDPTIAGHWQDVRQELGVPGLGIAPDHSPTWPTIRERLGLTDPGFWQFQPPRERNKRRDKRREAKAKRKQKRKDRKRNRKPR